MYEVTNIKTLLLALVADKDCGLTQMICQLPDDGHWANGVMVDDGNVPLPDVVKVEHNEDNAVLKIRVQQ